MKYCEVIVEIPVKQVDKMFTYKIPDGLTVSVGQRVLVPFGSRKLEGYCIALSETTSVDETALKSVISTLNNYPEVLPQLIDLAYWIKDRYRVTLDEALRLMIPAQMRGERVKVKQIVIWELAAEEDVIRSAIITQGRKKKCAEILKILLDGPLPAAILESEIGNVATPLKQLEEKNLIRKSSQEVLRKPYAALDHEIEPGPELKSAQKYVLKELRDALHVRRGRYLLHGVTGSGKTEVYIMLIKAAIAQGMGAIVLVPEIALTPQMVDWFRRRFGDAAALLHSGLSSGERFDEWRRIRRGDARIVIGARSAVFAPVENLGLLIIDEEHEQSYSSDKRPCYDAREVAMRRCENEHAVLMFGSATPSINTYMRCMPGVKPENKFILLEMHERVNMRPLPEVHVVDMRTELSKGNKSIFSVKLKDMLEECLLKGQQAILFINRRGFSSFVSCRACGHVIKCSACDVSMTYHLQGNVIRCHYCDREAMPPKRCPECGSEFIKYFGSGTQKVESYVKELFPHVNVLRMDVDTTRQKDSHEHIISAFRNGKAQILIGTQMIAKGLDFPDVTLVGVVAADMSLNLPDYRSVERTFQLLTQVAGRAGRSDKPGRVVIQTYDPDHYGIKLSATQDYRAFYTIEVDKRRRGLYPPFTILARLLVTSKSDEVAKDIAENLECELKKWMEENDLIKQAVQMRAMEAPLKLIKWEARWQVFIKLYSKGPSDKILDYMNLLAEQKRSDAAVTLEINPTNMI